MVEIARKLFERHVGAVVERIERLGDLDGSMGRQYLVEGDGREWFLSIADNLYPRIKTENHVACLKFIKAKTKIPVPEVAFWGVEDGLEYICTERMPGETLSHTWEELDEGQTEAVIDQVAGIYKDLRLLKGHSPTGLKMDGAEVVPGPRLSYAVYSNRHIANHWADYPAESFKTLNVCQVKEDEVELIIAELNRDIHVIETHKTCVGLQREFLPRLKRLAQSLENNKQAIERQELHFAHRDLHFGNILFDRQTNKITAVLDWELAGFFSNDNWEPGNTLAPIRDPTGGGSKLLPQWRERLFSKITPLPPSPNILAQYRSLESLAFWTTIKTIENSDKERRQGWITQFNSLLNEIT